MLKQGQVFDRLQYSSQSREKTHANVVQIGKIDGMSGLKTKLSDLMDGCRNS